MIAVTRSKAEGGHSTHAFAHAIGRPGLAVGTESCVEQSFDMCGVNPLQWNDLNHQSAAQ